VPKRKVVDDDKWYSNYDDDNPSSPEPKDSEDRLRSSDVCPGKDGSFTRGNCPSPPSCASVKETWGPAKLCINRAPMPWNKDKFYVIAMKCIPSWENW